MLNLESLGAALVSDLNNRLGPNIDEYYFSANCVCTYYTGGRWTPKVQSSDWPFEIIMPAVLIALMRRQDRADLDLGPANAIKALVKCSMTTDDNQAILHVTWVYPVRRGTMSYSFSGNDHLTLADQQLATFQGIGHDLFALMSDLWPTTPAAGELLDG